MSEKVYIYPNLPGPGRPLVYNEERCNGCNTCVEVCQMDILLANPEKGKAPIVMFPDECWYCGCCVYSCPREGALKMNFPLMWRVPWKRKDTGEHYWVGMKNPPPPNPKPLV